MTSRFGHRPARCDCFDDRSRVGVRRPHSTVVDRPTLPIRATCVTRRSHAFPRSDRCRDDTRIRRDGCSSISIPTRDVVDVLRRPSLNALASCGTSEMGTMAHRRTQSMTRTPRRLTRPPSRAPPPRHRDEGTQQPTERMHSNDIQSFRPTVPMPNPSDDRCCRIVSGFDHHRTHTPFT